MLKRISIISTSIFLCSCGIMPGMHNLDTSKVRLASKMQETETHPILIPITEGLISNQHLSRYNYQISPADILNIHVWEHPEFDFLNSPNAATFSTTAGAQGAAGQPGYLVNSNGQINFPLIGYITVGGNTMEEVRAKIYHKLRKYVPNPQINVRVADYRGQKVYVLGEVVKPGFLPITDQPLTIADALALSGGMDPTSANPRFTYVIRGPMKQPLIFWLDAKTPDKMLLAEGFSLQPRDIVFVSSAPATRWNRALNQVLPTIQTIWYTQAIVKNS